MTKKICIDCKEKMTGFIDVGNGRGYYFCENEKCPSGRRNIKDLYMEIE